MNNPYKLGKLKEKRKCPPPGWNILSTIYITNKCFNYSMFLSFNLEEEKGWEIKLSKTSAK